MKPRVGDPADASFVFGHRDSKDLGDVAREGLRVCGPILRESLIQRSL